MRCLDHSAQLLTVGTNHDDRRHPFRSVIYKLPLGKLEAANLLCPVDADEVRCERLSSDSLDNFLEPGNLSLRVGAPGTEHHQNFVLCAGLAQLLDRLFVRLVGGALLLDRAQLLDRLYRRLVGSALVLPAGDGGQVRPAQLANQDRRQGRRLSTRKGPHPEDAVAHLHSGENLAPGHHLLTLTVDDGTHGFARTTVEFLVIEAVNNAPVLRSVSPTVFGEEPEARLQQGQSMEFTMQVEEPDGDDVEVLFQ